MFCENCGNEINDNAMFCNACGEKTTINQTPDIINNNYIAPAYPHQQYNYPPNYANPPQAYPQQSYYQPYPQPTVVNNFNVPHETQKNNGWCLASFIVALVGWFFGALVGTAALVLGIIGLVTFDEQLHNNKWMGIVGIVSGIIEILVYLFLIGFFISLFSYY